MRCKTLILVLLVSATAFARPQMREVVRDSVVNAPFRDVLLTADRFCYEFQACPDSLFEWAYLGLDEAEIVESSSKESRDVIQLRYKDRVYDPTNKTGDVAIDIYVLGVRWWKNQHLGTKYVLSRPASLLGEDDSHLQRFDTGRRHGTHAHGTYLGNADERAL